MPTLTADRIKQIPIMQKCHVLYRICNNVRGMLSIMVQYVTNINNYQYHSSGIYHIDTGDAGSNTFDIIDEGGIFYF